LSFRTLRRRVYRRRNSWLAGLNDDHVDAIEAWQPYQGCEWTKHLASLSNIDKHNRLVTVNQALRFGARTTRVGASRSVGIIINSLLEVEDREQELIPTLALIESEARLLRAAVPRRGSNRDA
jgi:hypothetical protein